MTQNFEALFAACVRSVAMDWFWRDLKFGFRTISKDRAFLITAVLALALGIGSTTAIFSVIDNVLIEPFPYAGSQRFVASKFTILPRVSPMAARPSRHLSFSIISDKTMYSTGLSASTKAVSFGPGQARRNPSPAHS